MPELPDLVVLIERLHGLVAGTPLLAVRVASPFLMRSVDPPLSATLGKTVHRVHRMGKRIVLTLDDELFLILHLMVAGRLRWREAGAKVPARVGLAAFDFETGSAVLTEAGTKRRASLVVVRGADALAAVHRGGIEPLEVGADAFREALVRERHTLKRSLTDPRLFSGIGNSYSDEILFEARLSPFALTTSLDEDAHRRLYDATRAVLNRWVDELRSSDDDPLPEKMTAFRDGMTVHGRYGQPCVRCGAPIQRVKYAENEMNYCATCQTAGRLLADRALSRLLKGDWPKTLDDLENLKATQREANAGVQRPVEPVTYLPPAQRARAGDESKKKSVRGVVSEASSNLAAQLAAGRAARAGAAGESAPAVSDATASKKKKTKAAPKGKGRTRPDETR